MKVLKNMFEKTEKTNLEVQQEKSYPRKLVCEQCQSELEYEECDMRVGFAGYMYVDCPLCGHYNLLEDNENNVLLTADNVEFPTHFWHTSKATGAYDCCNNEMTRKYIRKAIDYFRNNKNEYDYQCNTGNFYINVHRFSGDKVYAVTVSNDFYEVDIPFEQEDY